MANHTPQQDSDPELPGPFGATIFVDHHASRILGFKFSCASLAEPDVAHAPSSPTSASIRRHSTAVQCAREVWVCNSDGYVGHMCLLSLQSEPIVTLNTPVPGCNSRITCICAVPPAVQALLHQSQPHNQSHHRHHHHQQQQQSTTVGDGDEQRSQSPDIVQQTPAISRQRTPANSTDVAGRRRRRHGTTDPHRPHRRFKIGNGDQGGGVAPPGGGSGPVPNRLPLAPHIRIEELREESEDGYASDSTTDSFSANDDDDDDNYEEDGTEEADTEDQSSPSTDQPGSTTSTEARRLHAGRLPLTAPDVPSAAAATVAPPSDSPPKTSAPEEGSPSTAAAARDGPAIDAGKGTMWLGTEDGCVLIFASSDIIKTTKNKIKVQQNAGVLSIVYLNQRVYVSIANGDILVYQRNEKDGCWDCTEPELVLGASNSAAPVNRMLPVGGRLWCACLNDIIVFNIPSHEVEVRFLAVSPADSKRGIQCMAAAGNFGVWLAGQGSCKVLLYHATTYEQLLEVSVAPAVSQKLQTADDIIRQHKMACLRVTALLACKDQLWVGTSAGVILTLPLPKLSLTTTKSSLSAPNVTGLMYGHTGHVRFLTSVDLGRSPVSSPISPLSQIQSASSSSSTPPSSCSSPSVQQHHNNVSPSSGAGSESGPRRHTAFSSSPSSTVAQTSSASSTASSQQTGTSSGSAQLMSSSPSSGAATTMTSARHRPPTPPTGTSAALLAAAVAGSASQSQQSAGSPLATIQTLPLSSGILVISGGDGFEDFRPPPTASSSGGVGGTSAAAGGASGVGAADAETTGRDDSTNHLLIWRIT